MKYDNAAYLKERYKLLRSLGLCVDCQEPADGFSKCAKCRQRFNAGQRAKAA